MMGLDKYLPITVDTVQDKQATKNYIGQQGLRNQKEGPLLNTAHAMVKAINGETNAQLLKQYATIVNTRYTTTLSASQDQLWLYIVTTQDQETSTVLYIQIPSYRTESPTIWMVTLEILDREIGFKVDTGAAVTTISRKCHKHLGKL